MKKFLLPFVAAAIGASLATAGEPSYKDKSIAPVDLFRAQEIEFGVFGAVGLGNVDHHDNTRTVHRTVTHIETTDLPPNNNGTTTVETKVDEKFKQTFKYRTTNRQGYGGGVEVNYFFTRNLGIGLEGTWLDASSVIHAVSANFIYRYPFEHGTWAWAPYAFAGGGGQFDGTNAAFGDFGLGAEFRFSPKWGVFSDGRWVIHDRLSNYALIRAGIRLVF
jgi:hypothetical protein